MVSHILTYILYTTSNRNNRWRDQEITIQTDTNVLHIVVTHIQFYIAQLNVFKFNTYI